MDFAAGNPCELRVQCGLELRSQLAAVTESRAPVWLREVEWRRVGTEAVYVDVNLVPLPDELEMVRAYLELEKLRLDDRLDYAIRTEGDVSRVRVPALVVQPLVENSIRHAVAARAAGGRVTVDAVVEGDRCRITVRDDGPGWATTPSDSGHGLASIRERLRLTFGAAFELSIREADGVTVEMVLPVAPQPAAVATG